MNLKRNYKTGLLIGAIALTCACRARKVNTVVSRSSDERESTTTEQSQRIATDSTGSKQIINELSITQSEAETVIYPTRGSTFHYDGRTFTGIADSIKHRFRSTTNKSSQQQFEQKSRRAVTEKTTKRVDAKEKHTAIQKSKQSDSKALIPSWVIALAAIIGCILLFLPFKQNNEPRKS